MIRDIQRLTQKEYDLVIIGAGIFGASIAWDAVQRGLSVALVEKGDFCHGSSAQHFKMIHGGMRYLQHLDIKRVRESSFERSTLIRIAPHMAYPLAIVIPTYGHGIKGIEVLRTGFFLYDMITLDRNKKINDPNRKIPSAKFLSKKEMLSQFPDIEEKNLTGGLIFYDGQIYSPPRLVISFLRSALNEGLEAANYLEVVDYLKKENRVFGVRTRDYFTKEEIEIRSKLVINAAGPWADQLNQKSLSITQEKIPTYSRDLLMVISRPLMDKYAFGHLAKTHDKDAVIDRGGRHIFIIPWREYSLIGVWHKVHNDSPDKIIVTDDEIKQYLEEVNKIADNLNLTLDDVGMVNTGLILFGDKNAQGGEQNHSFGKRSYFVDHSVDNNIEGLMTHIGVRATIARKDAQEIVDLALRKLKMKKVDCKTAKTPIFGGNIDNFEHLIDSVKEKYTEIHDLKTVRALAHNYGSEYEGVLRYAREDISLATTIGDSTVLKAEVIHAIREEMALNLGDIIFRRTDLGTAGSPGEDEIKICAELASSELNWDKNRIEKEIESVNNVFLSPGIDTNYHPARDAY